MLRARNVRKTFHQEGQAVHALADIEFALDPGETLGLVGESGSGKTTLARTLLGLTGADEGSVVELDGKPLASIIAKRNDEQVRALQIVFQNPDSALNRRFSIHRIIGRALTTLIGLTGQERESRLRELAHSVRFDVRLIGARPAQLSGGLKQRVAIARAFAGDPQVVVCDEPTSALDVSVQAAILNLLVELQADKGVSYLFISRDLGVVRYLSDRIAVLYLGRLMELGAAETVVAPPQHLYTEALLSAVPTAEGTERDRIRLQGEIPSAAEPPTGCVFHTRCPRYLGRSARSTSRRSRRSSPGTSCAVTSRSTSCASSRRRRLRRGPPTAPAPNRSPSHGRRHSPSRSPRRQTRASSAVERGVQRPNRGVRGLPWDVEHVPRGQRPTVARRALAWGVVHAVSPAHELSSVLGSDS